MDWHETRNPTITAPFTNTVGSLTGMDCRRVQKKDLRKKSGEKSPVKSRFVT